MTSQDIDRTFIAVNFEEVELEANDDKSLCRYEFLEITARLAKIKYFDKGTSPSIPDSTNRLITEHIIPNTCEVMPWQGFRDKLLWVLEIDDLFKANREGIRALYQLGKTKGKTYGVFEIHDAVRLVDEVGYTG